MNPLSVIIPTYNRALSLERAVESVLHQEGFRGEIVIIDDGSTDDTKKVVDRLKNRADINYLFSENRGPAAARNLGVSTSVYDTVAFLDSDDHWQSNKLAVQMKAMEDFPQYLISHTGEQWLRRGKHLNQKKIHKPRHGYIFDHCLTLCGVGMSTVVMRKELFLQQQGFDETLPCCEDYDFWLRISSNHFFLLIDLPLTIKEGGRTDQLSYIFRTGMDKFRIYAIEKLLLEYKLTNDQVWLAIAELKKKCRVYGHGCIKHGRKEEGVTYLAIAEKYNHLMDQ